MSSLKNLIKYFYEYPLDFFPVVEEKSELKGYILRKSALKDVNDFVQLNLDLKDFLIKNIVGIRREEYIYKLKIFEELKSFPVITTEGNIYIVEFEDFKKDYLMESKIDYKRILSNSRIGFLIFNLEKRVLFESNFYKLLELKCEDLSTPNLIEEIIDRILDESSNYIDNINEDLTINLGNIQLTYLMNSDVEKDRDGNTIIVTSLMPKAEMIGNEEEKKDVPIHNFPKNSEIDNLSNDAMIEDYLRREIVEKIDNEDFSLKSYLEEKEKFLLKTLSKILDNNTGLIAKVLDIDKEKVESKLKHLYS